MARYPNRLTAETVSRICAAISKGMFIAAAVRLAGVSESTWYEWRSKAQKGLPPYAEYLEQMQKAQMQAQHYFVSKLYQSAKKDWRCALAVLERRFPEWRLRDSPADTKLSLPPRADLSALSDEELDQLRVLVGKLDGA